MIKRSDWEVIGDTRDRLGESVLWRAEEQALWWIDFYGPTVRRFDPATGDTRQWTLPRTTTVGSIAFASGGRLLAAMDGGLCMFDPADGSLTPFVHPSAGTPSVGYNDAKVDRQENYWIGTYDLGESASTGALYRIDPDGEVTVVDRGYVVCNGPAFSPDGRTMYFSDTMERRILAYDLDEVTGLPGRQRTLAVFEGADGFPDGLCVDSVGALYCAHYGGGCVTRHSPDGLCLETFVLPVRNVTSCCLGGASLNTLYVTTADDAGRDPRDGALFARHALEPGLPEPIYWVGRKSGTKLVDRPGEGHL